MASPGSMNCQGHPLNNSGIKVSADFAIHGIYLWFKLRPVPGEPSHSQPTAEWWGTCWFNPYLLLCLDFSRSFSLSFLCSLCRCSRSLCLSLCLWESVTIRDESVKSSHELSPAHLPWQASQEAQWQDLNGMVAIIAHSIGGKDFTKQPRQGIPLPCL